MRELLTAAADLPGPCSAAEEVAEEAAALRLGLGGDLEFRGRKESIPILVGGPETAGDIRAALGSADQAVAAVAQRAETLAELVVCLARGVEARRQASTSAASSRGRRQCMAMPAR